MMLSRDALMACRAELPAGEAERITTAAWLSLQITRETGIEHSTVLRAFELLPANLWSLVDSSEGVGALSVYIAAMLGHPDANPVVPTKH